MIVTCVFFRTKILVSVSPIVAFKVYLIVSALPSLRVSRSTGGTSSEYTDFVFFCEALSFGVLIVFSLFSVLIALASVLDCC